MPHIVYYVASSIDGFIAPPDGSVSWLEPFQSSAEDYGYTAFYDSVDAIVMGSRTFQQVLGFGPWPYADTPVFVMSSRALDMPAGNVAICGADPAAVVAQLEGLGSRRTWLVGGGALAGAFHAAGLIDEYILSMMPVVLGEGIGVLGSQTSSARLLLTDAVRYPDGVMQLHYRAVCSSAAAMPPG